VNSIVGAGIIGLPFALREAGFIMGVLLLLAIGAMTVYSARLIVRLGILSERLNYEHVSRAVRSLCFAELRA
jgi:sodium-coupled neutral amino acid transporter 11